METKKNINKTSCRKQAHNNEFHRWMEKYRPVEREIMAERDRRQQLRLQRIHERTLSLSRAFGDLCEATEGRALSWRKNGFTSIEMAFDISTDALTRKTAERYFELLGQQAPRLPALPDVISGLVLMYFVLTLNIGAVAGCCALELVSSLAAASVADLKRRAVRPLYYERETARRRALAADRRRIFRRSTTNVCPSKEMILEAYVHRKDSKESAIRFGSIIHDLECYVDNSLRFADGRIIGRNQGVKGWLAENIPALACRYSTIMRYKAAAKKLKQLAELEDPVPAVAVLAVGEGSETEAPDEKILRGIAIYREMAKGVESATAMMDKIDIFLDPRRVEETTTLKVWREKYKNEITVRNKSRWWRRLMKNSTTKKQCGGRDT